MTQLITKHTDTNYNYHTFANNHQELKSARNTNGNIRIRA